MKRNYADAENPRIREGEFESRFTVARKGFVLKKAVGSMLLDMFTRIGRATDNG